MKSKSKIQENQFRAMVRKEIAKIIREDEQNTDQESNATQAPSKEEEPEIDRDQVLEKIAASFVKTLRNHLQDVSSDELATAFDDVMNHLQYGKQTKMMVLRTIKGKLEL